MPVHDWTKVRAGIFHDFPFGFERIFADARDPRRHFKLGCREKDADEAPHDHVVDLLLHLIEPVWCGSGRNDGEVVGDFGVIKNAFREFDPVALQRCARMRIVDLA